MAGIWARRWAQRGWEEVVGFWMMLEGEANRSCNWADVGCGRE